MAWKKTKTPEEMFDIKQKHIAERIKVKDEQKEITNKQIAFFNSVNAAIQMVNSGKAIKEGKEQKWTKMLEDWRDWFYGRWFKWYEKETTIQPISFEQGIKINEEFEKKMEEAQKQTKQAQLDEVNRELQEAKELEKEEIPVVEEEPEYNPEETAERQFEEHNK